MSQVFIFQIEDAGADAWTAEVAVVAGSRQEAYAQLRGAGLHKKQIGNNCRPVRVEPLSAWSERATSSSAIFRRRLDDVGWTGWERVAEGTSLDWRGQ